MQFTKLGDLEVVTRITGPHHHFLGIQLSPRPGMAPVLEQVSRDGNAIEPVASDFGAAISREVSEGISEANARLGTEYAVSRIRLCAADPSIEGVYRQLARALVEHVAQRDQAQSEHRGRAAQAGTEGAWSLGRSTSEATTEPGPRTTETGQFINADR